MADPFVSAACRGLAALDPPPRLLLAVSGGADSVALLDALWSGRARSDLQRLTFVVGHFDHGLRADSGRDRELVGTLAQARGLTFAHLAADQALSNEEAARDARYSALQRMAEELGCGAIVTAHTATDQAETLLWRLVRGAGSRGLGSMRASRKLGGLLLLRPLLKLTRDQTRAYCAARALTFHDDPTNENDRPRARLRAEVLPILERLAPGAVERLAAAADRLREDDDWLEQSASRTDHATADQLAALPPAIRRRALAAWAAGELGSRQRLTAAHIAALEALVSSGRGEVDLPASAEVRKIAVVENGRLVLRTYE